MTKEEYILKEDYKFYEDKRIWSKAKKRFLKGYVHPKGYVQVWLKCTDGKIKEFLWHRVIWFAFKGKIPDGYQINHIDENKQNNALSNLNLMTPKENSNWATRNERVAESHTNNPLRSKSVVAVDKDGVVVMEFPSTAEAGRNGFNRGHVAACCRGEYYGEGNRFFKGYYWYYKEDWEKINQKR